MTEERLRDEITELLTIQIALDDKLHRMQEEIEKIKHVLLNTGKRIDIIKKETNEER